MIMVRYYTAFGEGVVFIGWIKSQSSEGYWVDGKNSRGEEDERYILTESIRRKQATILYASLDYETI